MTDKSEIKWVKWLKYSMNQGDDMDTIVTVPPTPEDRFKEKRDTAIAHLNTVQRGKKRGAFSLPRVHFDPTIQSHLQSYKTFLDTGAWGTVVFHMEFPYDSVIETVTRKFANHVLEHMLSIHENGTQE